MIDPLPPARSRPWAQGFTTMELMVTVAVLGVVAAVVVPANQVQWRRERVNAAALELTSWLEVIARTPDQTGTNCTVTVTTGTNRAPGAPLASVNPPTCAPESTLNLPATVLGASSYNVGASSNTITFTPRGAVSSTVPIQVRISVDGQLPLRCVQVTGLLGLLRLGNNNTTGNVGTACDASQFNRA
ncbi:MAG: prepilin-type N-terminal cleavage/methylation domain-containing protein [Cyanobium sp. CZS 25K]|nr:prepilin-type N-terminal cleavage/methylation domain-containing protein [Cyanobium sp. CZS25K]